MNNSQTPNPRKDWSDNLAELLREDSGRRTARLLQALGLLGAEDPRGKTSVTAGAETTDAPQPISIWQPRRLDGDVVFERPAPRLLGDHHAAVRRFSARKTPGTTRLAFFGESVAAGYLYAPHATPAGLLQTRLDVAAPNAFEVIDLARTNESLEPLVRTVEASLQLDPDVFVFFIGNNWNLLELPDASPYAPSVPGRQRCAAALRRGGLRAWIADVRRRLDAKARRVLKRLADLTRGRRVIVLIPEVNLFDWPSLQPPVWLAGDDTASWHRGYDQAIAALERQDANEALQVSEAMIRLDDGLCPASHRLRGQALQALGRTEEARQAFEREVDADAYASLAFLGAPRASSRVRELLAEGAKAYGWSALDVRSILDTSGDNADRRIFLDYCHLTWQGMERVTTALASALLDRPVDPALPSSADPGPEVRALAELGAAVHTAHRLVGEKQEWLEYWLRQALASSPSIVDTVRDLVEVRCGRLPAVLHAAQQRQLARPVRLLLQHGWRWDFLDADLLLAIRRVLAEAGQPIDETLDTWLVDNHAPTVDGLELTRAPYLWDPLARLYTEAMDLADLPERAFYRALWPRTRVALVSDGVEDISLQVIARLPTITGAPPRPHGRVELWIDQERLTSFELVSAWMRQTVRVPRLDRGLHRLTLHWPPLQPVGNMSMAHAIDRLEEGLEADLHPIFGEIFSLRATVENEGSTREICPADRERPQRKS